MIRYVILLLCTSASIGFAADRYWDTSPTAGLQSGDGAWDTGLTSIWSTAAAGTALTTLNDNDNAFFRTGGTSNVTVSGTILLNSLTQAVTATNTISGGTLQFQSDAGITNSSATSIVINSDVTFNSGNMTVAASNAGVVFAGSIGEIGGSRGWTKTGTGNVTIRGTTSNTYTGLTTVGGGGVLTLDKTTGIAIPGDLTITGGTRVRFSGTNTNQLANTSNVIMSGVGSVFNGDGVNTNVGAFSETFASLTVTGGTVNAGTGTKTVTGAGSFTGGAGSTAFIGNSGSNYNFGSLSVTGMSATAGNTVGLANSFTVYGAHGTLRSQLVVGSGGLSLNGSVINLRLGASGQLGSRLILNGNVTTSGTSNSGVLLDTAGGATGTVSVDLSSAGATVNRTFTVGGGGADLTIGVPVVNGTATTAGITKEGAGTLFLTAANTYNGGTTVNAGTLGGTGSLASAVTVAAGAALLGGDGATATDDLAIAGNVSLATDSIIKLTLGAGGAHSSLTRTSGTWVFAGNQKFTFADLGATAGVYNNIIAGILNPGSLAGWTITNPGWTGSFAFDGANIDFTLTAIPEPTAGLLLLAGAALLGVRRSRQASIGTQVQ